MGKDIKSNLKNLARQGEAKLTESILKWKNKKENIKPPSEEEIRYKSRVITDQANRIMAERGKNILEGVKTAYRENRNRRKNKD